MSALRASRRRRLRQALELRPPPVVPPDAVRQLYESVLSSRRHARTQLQAIQDIERRHVHTPLAVLADLAVHHALAPATSSKEEDPLR